jgi:glyoxylase-like metal-dependent hydrolase (beta-lactamase superfamily II)
MSSRPQRRSEEVDMRFARRPRERRQAVLMTDLAEGVHGVEHAHTNCYLVEDAEGVTLVDACFPSTAAAVVELLARIGRTPRDIRAVLLTHGHFDHVGFARGLKSSLGTPVWVHGADRMLAAHPYRYRPERNRVAFSLGHGRSWPILGRMVLAGALAVRGVDADDVFADGDVLSVPGRPRVIHTPGHTAGQCALLLSDRGVLLSGDALVTLDPYTGRRGPRLVASAATADSDLALESLGRLVGCGARIVLPGHGAAWRGGAEAAVVAARHAVVDAVDAG